MSGPIAVVLGSLSLFIFEGQARLWLGISAFVCMAAFATSAMMQSHKHLATDLTPKSWT
jgi:hypothetical protein